MTLEDLDIQFARIGDGGIGALNTTFDAGLGHYTYNFDCGHWEPKWLDAYLWVQMYDICPTYDLRPFEFWIWNERQISLAIQPLKGNGVLTVVYRNCWPWHMGLAWTTHPLEPKYDSMTTGEPPSWWGAEDTFAEWSSYEELEDAVVAEQHRLLNEHHHQLLQRLP